MFQISTSLLQPISIHSCIIQDILYLVSLCQTPTPLRDTWKHSCISKLT